MQDPGVLDSIRIINLRDDAIIPDPITKIKYKIPMSLWLVG